MSSAATAHCRERARRCTELAAGTRNTIARQFFETCATMWNQFAADREREILLWANLMPKRPTSA
jgi:hypothetical protein